MNYDEVMKRSPLIVYQMEETQEETQEEPKKEDQEKIRVLDGEAITDEDDEEEFEDDLDKSIDLLNEARNLLSYLGDWQLSKGIVMLKDRVEINRQVKKIDKFLEDLMELSSDIPPDDVSYKVEEGKADKEDDPKPLNEHPTHCPKCGQKNIIDKDQLNAVYCPNTNDPINWKGHYFVGLEENLEFDKDMSPKEKALAERILSNMGLS